MGVRRGLYHVTPYTTLSTFYATCTTFYACCSNPIPFAKITYDDLDTTQTYAITS